MTELTRKPGTLSIAQPEPDHSTFGKQPEHAEAMVPVKVLRGYWPKGKPGDVELVNPLIRLVDGAKLDDPKRIKLLSDALCTLPEDEAQTAADNGIVRILTAKGYRDAQEAAAVAAEEAAKAAKNPRTTIIHRTA